MANTKYHSEITSSLQEELRVLSEEIEQEQKSRVAELQLQVNAKQELADLDQYVALSNKDKLNYMYRVKPQLTTIKKMIDKGFTEVKIAEALQVPYASLKRMRENIPELEEVFYLGKLNQIQIAEVSLMQLAQPNVIQEQVVTKDGDVITIDRYREPNIQAVKLILQSHKRDEYGDKREVLHKQHISEEVTDALKALSTETLERLLKNESAIDITEDVEVRDTNEQ